MRFLIDRMAIDLRLKDRWFYEVPVAMIFPNMTDIAASIKEFITLSKINNFQKKKNKSLQFIMKNCSLINDVH